MWKLLCLGILLSGAAQAANQSCKACNLLEDEGDKAYREIKQLPLAELDKSDDSGYTVFFWSVYHGARKTQDFLLKTIGKDKLLANPANASVIATCASSSDCKRSNLDKLLRLGFKADSKALPNTITGTGTCAIDKFLLLLENKAPTDYHDASGNLLHVIVARSAGGRPVFPRHCFIKAIDALKKAAPELMSQKNSKSESPKEMAEHLGKGELGSGVSAKDMEPIIKAFD